jgi:type III secretion system FlhB-like substrate exporter
MFIHVCKHIVKMSRQINLMIFYDKMLVTNLSSQYEMRLW